VSNSGRALDQARTLLPWVAAVAAIIVVVIAHVSVAIGSTSPIFFTDEVGYIANAQLIAGVGEPRSFSASSYYIGWSLLLVPLWWISQDPQFVYVGSVALSVACGIAVIAPLSWIGRRLGLSVPLAIVAASAVAVAPARLVMSNFGLAENFIALLMGGVAVAAFRFADAHTVGRAALLSALAAYLFVTHARTAPVLIATALWIVVVSWRKWRVLLASFATMAVIAIPGFLLYRSLVPIMYSAAADREERGLNRLLELDPGSAATAAIGQLWYAFAAWYAFALLAIIVMVSRAVVEIRDRKPGVASWGSLVFLGTLSISVVWIAAAIERGDPRLDIFAYGRYLDSVLAVLALVGIALASSRLSSGLGKLWAVASIAIVVLFFAVVSWQVPSGAGVWWGPNSVAGLIHWDWPNITAASRPPWIIASAVAVVVVAGVIGFHRFVDIALVRLAIPALALAFFLASGVVAESKTMQPYISPWHQSFTLRTDIGWALDAYPDASISFDRVGLSDSLSGVDTVSRNSYQFWLTPRALPVFTSEESDPDSDFVISRKDWARAQELGAVLVAEDTGMFNNALWVMPGVTLDAMLDSGDLP
jgi:hypothetical protein